MSGKDPVSFVEWLNGELAERGWSDYHLARLAGISHSVISKARRGSPPGWEACEAIAAAFGLPAELVFRRAGLLSTRLEQDPNLEEWKAILSQLPEKDRYELLQIARLKLELQEREEAENARRVERVGQNLQPNG